jgi:cytochrome c-type biogenesis protein CcmH/NrfG
MSPLKHVLVHKKPWLARAKIKPIMRRPNTAQITYISLISFVFVASATALAFTWPHARALLAETSRKQAAQLISEAAGTAPPEAAVNYQLATWLDPSNEAGFLGVARIQIAVGHAETALKALDHAGEGSEAASLRTRTTIELGRTSEAARRAASLAIPGRPDTDIILAALAYALANRPSDIPALMPLVSSPEAAGRITRIAAGDVALANELYASKLPESSRTILEKLPTSFERNLLLGHIYHDRHSLENLATATGFLVTAVTINPANIEAHQLLAAVYAERGLIAESSDQTTLAQKLISKRP